MKVVMTLDQANQILAYLQKQPYADVFQLFDLIKNCVVNEDKPVQTEQEGK